jgi:hypothetical protein
MAQVCGEVLLTPGPNLGLTHTTYRSKLILRKLFVMIKMCNELDHGERSQESCIQFVQHPLTSSVMRDTEYLFEGNNPVTLGSQQPSKARDLWRSGHPPKQ